uniref:GOLD domain-containing protein n=1 Tax=Panagrellus redivivus TaxID=6233 RepID=A0A7E4W2S2_PANRE
MNSLLRLVVALAAIEAVTGLYFHIAETERKCFIEEIPDETMVIGNYKVQLYDPNTKGYGDYPNIGMHVEVDQITKEQNYQRYREERFRQTSESTNSRVLYWSITQVAVLILTGAWQMKHLKGFFEAKKLV